MSGALVTRWMLWNVVEIIMDDFEGNDLNLVALPCSGGELRRGPDGAP